MVRYSKICKAHVNNKPKHQIAINKFISFSVSLRFWLFFLAFFFWVVARSVKANALGKHEIMGICANANYVVRHRSFDKQTSPSDRARRTIEILIGTTESPVELRGFAVAIAVAMLIHHWDIRWELCWIRCANRWLASNRSIQSTLWLSVSEFS